MSEEYVTRRAVRHAILRRRNARIAEDRDDRWPLLLRVHPETRADLLTDGDPAEQWTLDFEGHEFMGIPLQGDPSLQPGEVAVDWPKVEVSGG